MLVSGECGGGTLVDHYLLSPHHSHDHSQHHSPASPPGGDSGHYNYINVEPSSAAAGGAGTESIK